MAHIQTNNIFDHIKRYWLNYCILALVNLFIVLIFLSGNYQRDWSTRADQELTLAYNAVLINSGFIQEYLDHPGFFTVQGLALLMRTLHAIGETTILTITDLNQAPSLFDGFNEIVLADHYLSLLSTLLLISLSYVVTQFRLKNNLVTAILVICIFFTSSISEHFFFLRTELITFIFLITSVLFFSRINRQSGINLFFTTILACTFLFCAAVNKAQVMLYFPIYLIWSLKIQQLSPNQYHVDTKDVSKYFALGCILLNLIFFGLMAKGLSIAYQIVYISTLNLIIYLLCRKKPNLYQLITFFNVNYILGYCIVALIVFLLGHNISLFFVSINSPLEMLKWAVLNQTVQENGAIEIGSIFWRALAPLVNIITLPDSQLILVAINIFLGAYLYKSLSLQFRQAIAIGLFAFYSCSVISSIRYWAPHYFIFSEFFLMVNIVILIGEMKFRNLQIAIAAITLISVLSVNLAAFEKSRNITTNKRSEICKETYMADWHHQIDQRRVLIECLPYTASGNAH